MMKNEFEALLGGPVTEKEYSKIEYVYTWHPCISDTEGKHQIAYLYHTFGMRIILDMMDTAEKAELLNNDMQELLMKQEEIKAKMDWLKRANYEDE